jgi:hypothetical protein
MNNRSVRKQLKLQIFDECQNRIWLFDDQLVVGLITSRS